MLETVENKRDEKFLRKIRGFDLFAREASFHSSCHRQYQRNPTHRRSANEKKNKKTREDGRTFKSKIGRPLQKFEPRLKEKPSRVKES